MHALAAQPVQSTGMCRIIAWHKKRIDKAIFSPFYKQMFRKFIFDEASRHSSPHEYVVVTHGQILQKILIFQKK